MPAASDGRNQMANKQTPEPRSIRKYLVLLQDSLAIKFEAITSAETAQESNTKNPLHPEPGLKGFLLFKAFTEVNLECYWNDEIQSAFKELDYKGTVVPSTILVSSRNRKHIVTLKNAWAQKTLRCPSGFKIQFLGEIEELIADPIDRTHFIPLGDSVCNAIHELTSKGNPCFVDDIAVVLSENFPDTVLPSKDILFQILEKLTKNQKVYQTPEGYFLMTPETRQYIRYTDPVFIKQDIKQFTMTEANNKKRVEGPVAETTVSREDSPILKRTNSLRIQQKGRNKVSGCLPRRTFSMRIHRSHAKPDNMKSLDVQLSRLSVDSAPDDAVLKKRRKHKSFLKSLLSFRNKGKKNRKRAKKLSPPITISTQTSNSLENLNQERGIFALPNATAFDAHEPALHLQSTTQQAKERDSDSGHFTDTSSSPQSHRLNLGLDTNSPSSKKHFHALKLDCGIRSEKQNAEPLLTPYSLTSEPELKPFISSASSSVCSTPSPRLHMQGSPKLRTTNGYNHKYSYTLPRNGYLSSKPPIPPFKYPPRPAEKRQIFERVHKQATTSINSRKPTNPTGATNKTNLEVELLLPLGKLIDKVLYDFGESDLSAETDKHTPKNQSVDDLFTFGCKSSMGGGSNSFQVVSSKPSLQTSELCRESEII